jgi:hypothetical protein
MSRAGLQATTDWLDEHEVKYELVEHPLTFTAKEEASATRVPPAHVAKVVALHDRAASA